MSDQLLNLEFPKQEDTGGLWVPGTPRQKGSVRWIAKMIKGKPRAVPCSDKSSKLSKAWERKVASAARQWWGPEMPLEGPVQISLVFYFLRPNNHYRTGKFAGSLREDAPHVYCVKPDPDKLARNVLDALGGKIIKMDPLVYIDDCQVEPLIVQRRYCDAYNQEEGVRIYLLGTIDGKEIGHLPGAQDA